MPLPSIKACLFDMDGLLLDTEGFYTVVQNQIAQRYGKEFTWELKSKMMGKRGPEAASIYVESLGISDKISAEEFLREREEMLDKMFPNSELLPGVERLLRHLRAHNVPMCVATSSKRAHFDLKTRNHKELFALFDHIVTGDEVKNGKPDPEIFLAARGQWDGNPPPAAACLVFEDAPTGVGAALAAGMPVVMVPDARLEDPKSGGEPTAVLASLVDFSPGEWGLPPY
mmetsp:Transcript_70200/g.222574  ORF Transcript_70200/g.222574 Transcript_70200/m.222574 type:complete len:228 (+) Transcript_70200:121-804(+)